MIGTPEAWQLPRMPSVPASAADLADQLRREGGCGVGEIGPVPGHRHPGQFPMARGRVLAARDLGRGAPAALRARRPDPGHRSARGQADRRAQAQAVEHRQAQAARCARSARPAAQAAAIWPSVLAPVVAKGRRHRARRRSRPNPSRSERRGPSADPFRESGAALPGLDLAQAIGGRTARHRPASASASVAAWTSASGRSPRRYPRRSRRDPRGRPRG